MGLVDGREQPQSRTAMTTHDQNKKTLRHFQCRDYLWDIFEQMSTELECSTDYLINEAMRQYARSRNYGTARSAGEPLSDAPPRTDTPLVPPADNAAYAAASSGIPSLRDTAQRGGSLPSPPPPRARTAAQAHAAPTVPVAMPSRAPGPPKRPTGSSLPAPPPPPPPPPPGARSTGRGVQPAMTNPPPLPGGAVRPAPANNARPRSLYIIFNGQKIPVTKEEFVIGRGSKSADLAIKDGNISRRHAAVVLHNGAYYLKDLGSTNGVEFQGRRFDSKRIDEGDLFRICDYELRFTYQ
jgi:neural Wiskott-Aldrich syndrome protein